MGQVEAHVRSVAPNARITENLPGDIIIVDLGAGRTFQISPPYSSSYETPATWPIYVTPIPSEAGGWECHTLDEIGETLRWPSVIPKIRKA